MIKYGVNNFIPPKDFVLVEVHNHLDIYYNVPSGYLKYTIENKFVRCVNKTKKCFKCDIGEFKEIFGDILIENIRVSWKRYLYKQNHLYFYHDVVDDLGEFIRVPMETNVNMFDVIIEEISLSYYKLMIQKRKCRDFNYYKSTNKVFWTLNTTINSYLFDNQTVPCIFVERVGGKYYILQLDFEITQDKYLYTAWRKIIGKSYDIWVDVLLIASDDKLYTLDGNVIHFDDLGRSNVVVDKKYLARFDINTFYQIQVHKI
jgi:adenylate cyclase class IV